MVSLSSRTVKYYFLNILVSSEKLTQLTQFYVTQSIFHLQLHLVSFSDIHNIFSLNRQNSG